MSPRKGHQDSGVQGRSGVHQQSVLWSRGVAELWSRNGVNDWSIKPTGGGGVRPAFHAPRRLHVLFPLPGCNGEAAIDETMYCSFIFFVYQIDNTRSKQIGSIPRRILGDLSHPLRTISLFLFISLSSTLPFFPLHYPFFHFIPTLKLSESLIGAFFFVN